MSDEFINDVLILAEQLRKQKIACDISFQGGNLKKKLQRAENKSNNVIIFGEDELRNSNYKIKNFTSSQEENVTIDKIKAFIQQH